MIIQRGRKQYILIYREINDLKKLKYGRSMAEMKCGTFPILSSKDLLGIVAGICLTHMELFVITNERYADARQLNTEQLCNPMISDSTPHEDGFRQIECATSTCDKVNIIQYEKKGIESAEQWTPVFESVNQTHHALYTNSSYSLDDRYAYVTFQTKTLLYIQPLVLEDHGKWRCVVYGASNVKYESQTLDVNVYKPARVLYPNTNMAITMDSNSAFVLKCNGDGQMPWISWRKDGNIIVNNDTRYIIKHNCNDSYCESWLKFIHGDDVSVCLNGEDYSGVYICDISLNPPYKSTQTSPHMDVNVPQTQCQKENIGLLIGISIPVVVSLTLILSFIGVLIFKRKKKRNLKKQQENQMYEIIQSEALITRRTNDDQISSAEEQVDIHSNLVTSLNEVLSKAEHDINEATKVADEVRDTASIQNICTDNCGSNSDDSPKVHYANDANACEHMSFEPNAGKRSNLHLSDVENLSENKDCKRKLNLEFHEPEITSGVSKHDDSDSVNSQQSNKSMIVAIDFGTTYSGYAYKVCNQDKILVNKTWESDVGFQSSKVPTCVLTEGDSDKFVAFGYEAQSILCDDKYGTWDSGFGSDTDASRDSDHTPQNLHYYDEFKMVLHGNKRIEPNMTVEAYDGHTCKAINIFAMALRYMKADLFGHIQKQTGQQCAQRKYKIQWVLTVPSIWADDAKQFMRKCAVKAGIVSKDSPNELLLALEPEVASLYCRQFCHVDNNLESKPQGGIPPNSRYLVVDCGGGTVDVTAHHYKSHGEICELYAASGGGWGGRNINSLFERKVNEVLGEDVMEKFKVKHPKEYLDMKIKFERDKRSIFEMQNTNYHFKLPRMLTNLCKSLYGAGVWKNRLKSNTAEHHIGFTKGQFIFDKSVLENIFKTTFEDTIHHITTLVEKTELQGLQYLFLVGGFSECPKLQSELQKAISRDSLEGRNINVVSMPWESSEAVLKGAVLFGENQCVITSRRSKGFYYISPDMSQTLERQDMNHGTFEPIISQNEKIVNEDVRKVEFRHIDGNTLTLYHYQKDIFGKANKNRNTISIDLTNVLGPTKNTSINIYLYFGKTELHVSAENDKYTQTKWKRESKNGLTQYTQSVPISIQY